MMWVLPTPSLLLLSPAYIHVHVYANVLYMQHFNRKPLKIKSSILHFNVCTIAHSKVLHATQMVCINS